MKEDTYKNALQSINAQTDGETDLIAIMSTIACELFHAFDYFNWVGFYRRVDADILKVGPYQGTHGCLSINFDRGVCGKCARDAEIQIENNIAEVEHHIACSTETQAEIVLPIIDNDKNVIAVLDIDSTSPNVFDDVDITYLKKICLLLSTQYIRSTTE